MIRKFLYVDPNGDATEAYVDGAFVKRSCDTSAIVNDLVVDSTIIPNGVDVVIDNLSSISTLGFIVEKESDNVAIVCIRGFISGITSLNNAKKVYLGIDGKFSPSIPDKGYLHIMGNAVAGDVVSFNPVNTKIKIADIPFVTEDGFGLVTEDGFEIVME